MSEIRCEKCNDLGWVYDKNGNAIRCDCISEKEIEKVNKSLNIPRKYYHSTLSNFKPILPSHIVLIEKIKEYIYSNDYKEGKGIFFYGKHGVGKTHLAVSILKEFYFKRHITGLFYDTRILLYDLKSTFEGNTSTRELLNEVIRSPILVLDDLASERLTDWAKDILHYIIISRYNDKLPVIITSNLSLEDEEDFVVSIEGKFGKGIASRLSEICTLLLIEGEDQRKSSFKEYWIGEKND